MLHRTAGSRESSDPVALIEGANWRDVLRVVPIELDGRTFSEN